MPLDVVHALHDKDLELRDPTHRFFERPARLGISGLQAVGGR